MTARINKRGAADRLLVVAFVLTLLIAACTFVAGFLDLPVWRTLAIVAAGMTVVTTFAGIVRDPCAVNADVEDVDRVNPATGLPMLPGLDVDARGNVYGRHDH